MKRTFFMLIMLLLSGAVSAQVEAMRFDFTTRGKAPEGFVRIAATTAYSQELGYGYDLLPAADRTDFRFSVAVPDGNYRVTVTLGSDKEATHTVVRGESSRLLVADCVTARGEKRTHAFTLNKRNPHISGRESVSLKSTVARKRNWDERLTLEFTGEKPSLLQLIIEPVQVTTLFLFGDSTVCDYDDEPYASWGQMITAFFDAGIAVANYAETGETASSCMGSKRLAKGLSQLKQGDYVFIELGHNDQKKQGAGKGAYYSFSTEIKTMIDYITTRGGKPVLVTPLQRRRWKDGEVVHTHGDYPEAVRTLAAREQLPLIDLNVASTKLLEALGEEGSKALHVFMDAGTLPNQKQPLHDNSHFSPYGAYEVARCVVEAIRSVVPELAHHLHPNLPTFNPEQPDPQHALVWPFRVGSTYEKPAGS